MQGLAGRSASSSQQHKAAEEAKPSFNETMTKISGTTGASAASPPLPSRRFPPAQPLPPALLALPLASRLHPQPAAAPCLWQLSIFYFWRARERLLRRAGVGALVERGAGKGRPLSARSQKVLGGLKGDQYKNIKADHIPRERERAEAAAKAKKVGQRCEEVVAVRWQVGCVLVHLCASWRVLVCCRACTFFTACRWIPSGYLDGSKCARTCDGGVLAASVQLQEEEERRREMGEDYEELEEEPDSPSALSPTTIMRRARRASAQAKVVSS